MSALEYANYSLTCPDCGQVSEYLFVNEYQHDCFLTYTDIVSPGICKSCGYKFTQTDLEEQI